MQGETETMDLREYLMEERYSNGKCIMDIYLKSDKEYKKMVLNGEVEVAARTFFVNYGKQLIWEMKNVHPGLRKLAYHSAIDNYLEGVEEARKAKERKALHDEAVKKAREEIALQKKEERERIEREHIEAKRRKGHEMAKSMKAVPIIPNKKSTTSSRESIQKKAQAVSADNVNKISMADFVVHSNVFKCMHNGHTLENITAITNVMGKSNVLKTTRVSAGYCRKCNTYFIMDNDFKRLKAQGQLFCRMVDYKTYTGKNIIGNRMALANESILMQYGYNVSQLTDLTSKQRQAILAMLIDCKIMTKSEINSYLSFFIRQRQKQQDKYEVAIEKWSEDRAFVSKYREGSFRKVHIESIIIK